VASRRHEPPSVATVFRVVFAAAGALLLLYCTYKVRSVLMLVLVAAFLAIGLDPAVAFLERKGLKRGLAVTAIFLAVLLAFVGFIAAVVPPLVDQVSTFATELPEYVDSLAQRNDRVAEFVRDNDIADRLREAIDQAPTQVSGSLGTVVGVAGSILGKLFNGLTVIVLMIYFSLSLSHMREGSLKLVPKSRRGRVKELADPILEKIGSYIAGNVAVSIIAGVVSFIFFIIAGVPYPVALALWVAIADLIPLVGATLGMVPALVVAFFISIPVGIATAVFFLIYQQVENYVIVPRVMTKAIDISPAAVLLAALIGGSLLGFVGALMALPFAAAVKLLMQEVALPKLEKG
jgi:predicted PurR-regulated permease PerM